MDRMRLEGDHSGYHCGCTAVFSALRRIAREKGWTLARKDEDYDVLLMNGEGTMHDGSDGFHAKMKLLRAALDGGKRAYLVNSVWQDNPNDYDDVLQELSGVTTREVRSQADLLVRHGIASRVLPDVSISAALPFWSFPINFRGKPALTDFYWPATNRFGKADDELFRGVPFLPFETMSWGRAVASIKTASYLITGRQHGVYAACKARVPFAASEGNTHKIRGLMDSAEVEIPVADSPEQIRDIIPMIPKLRDEYAKLFDWLARQDYASIVPSPSQ